jgi:hypothetical protein
VNWVKALEKEWTSDFQLNFVLLVSENRSCFIHQKKEEYLCELGYMNKKQFTKYVHIYQMLNITGFFLNN